MGGGKWRGNVWTCMIVNIDCVIAVILRNGNCVDMVEMILVRGFVNHEA
jgi:hypothetical protein